MWKRLLQHTEREKQGALDGLNLFFGALLGANLGTMDHDMSNRDYLIVIGLLASVVIVIRQISTSERRLYMLLSLFVTAMIVAAMLLLPNTLDGVPVATRERLGITFGVWLATVTLIEILPVHRDLPADTTKTP